MPFKGKIFENLKLQITLLDNFIKTIKNLFILDPQIIDLNSGANSIWYFFTYPLVAIYMGTIIIFILGQHKRFSKMLVHIAHLVYILGYFLYKFTAPNYILNTACTPSERSQCLITYLLHTTVGVAYKRENRETKKKTSITVLTKTAIYA